MRDAPSSAEAGLQQLHTVAVHPSQNDVVAVGGSDGSLSIWDLRAGQSPAVPLYPKSITQPHTSHLWEAAFHPDARGQLVTCSEDGMLLHWSASSSGRGSSDPSLMTDSSNLQIASLLTGNLAINSVDVVGEFIACGTDSETLVVIAATA